MISAEVEGRLPYMTYPEPWRGPPKQQPEFLRPQPKPFALSKYNGLNATTSGLNGTRLMHTQRTAAKYSPPAVAAPVNLTQQHQPLKDDMPEELTYGYHRTYPPTTFAAYPHPQYHLYHHPYQAMLRSTFVQPPSLSPLEPYTPSAPIASTNTGTFLSPPTAYSPPSRNQILLRNERLSSTQSQPPPTSLAVNQNFKVPSGKEGSLKHRILQTRSDDSGQKCAIDLHKSPTGQSQQQHQENVRKRLPAVIRSPPPPLQSPAPSKVMSLGGNHYAEGATNFDAKPNEVIWSSARIDLSCGNFKNVQDLKAEDFVRASEYSSGVYLADSTVVKIAENPIAGTATITLSYYKRRCQHEVEYPLEQPLFVYGKGWSSCNPDRTNFTYGWGAHLLQVGDVVVSLMRKPEEWHPSTPPTRPPVATRLDATYTTTATTTAMTVRQVSTCSGGQATHRVPTNHSISHLTGTATAYSNQRGLSPESLSKKRRWSAPSQIDEEEEEHHVRRKVKAE